MLLREIQGDLKVQICFLCIFVRVNKIELSFFSPVIFRFMTIPIKIPAGYFYEYKQADPKICT